MSTEYAVYKGEAVVAVGTADECVRQLSVSTEYIKWMTTPTSRKRNKGNRMQAYRIEGDAK